LRSGCLGRRLKQALWVTQRSKIEWTDWRRYSANLDLFFDFFPELKGKRLIGVFGSWAMPDPVVEHSTALKIYALRMGEDTMELANAAAIEGASPLP